MKQKVAKISIEATVAGKKLAVEGATISLGVNAIPSIELACAPSEPKTMEPMNPNVYAPKIADYNELYGDLASKAEGRSVPGDVSIEISGDYSDSVNLSGWILSGVGLSSVSASAAPHLSVILQHPICKLTKVGSIYETPKDDMATAINKACSSATDFLKVMTSAYSCVKNLQYWPCPKDYTLPPEYRQNLGTGEFDPNEYLVWKGLDGQTRKGGGLFLGNALRVPSRMAQAIGRFVMPNSTGTSTWDTILAACGKLLTSVTQDQSNNYTTKQLVLEPVQPWKECEFSIDEEWCSWTELPGMDPVRLIGVMARKLGPCGEPINLRFMKNGNPLNVNPTHEVMYAPKVGIKHSDGRIMKISAPDLLEDAYRRDAPSGKSIVLSNIKLALEYAAAFDNALGKYCKAVYETTAASMIQASMQMPVSFRVGGKLLVPGNTCKLTSKGQDVYYGYVRQVVHTLSTGGGNSTIIGMSYVRPHASYEINGKPAIPAGSKNAAYE